MAGERLFRLSIQIEISMDEAVRVTEYAKRILKKDEPVGKTVQRAAQEAIDTFITRATMQLDAEGK